MSEAVIFPDVEALLVAYLTPLLGGVEVGTQIPNPRPDTFVRVTRVGGARRDRITDQPLVVVQAWATDEAAAQNLGARAQAHVFALEQTSVGDSYVRAVREVGGFQAVPDPLSGTPRYQFTAQLDTRGVAL